MRGAQKGASVRTNLSALAAVGPRNDRIARAVANRRHRAIFLDDWPSPSGFVRHPPMLFLKSTESAPGAPWAMELLGGLNGLTQPFRQLERGLVGHT
jgi:hypothetical protein